MLIYSFINLFQIFKVLSPHNNFLFSSPFNKIIDKYPCSIHLQIYFFPLFCFTISLALSVPQPLLSAPWETCFLKKTLAYRDTFISFYSPFHVTVISLHIWNTLLLLWTPFTLFCHTFFMLHTEHLSDFMQPVPVWLIFASCGLQGFPLPPLSQASLVSTS